MKDLGGFDPIAYAGDVKARPEAYVSMKDIAIEAAALKRVRHAASLEELKTLFQAFAKQARESGNIVFLDLLKERKDSRKKELGS